MARVLLILFVGALASAADPLARVKRANMKSSFNQKWNATAADRLKRDLLLNYDKYTRPNQENMTMVTFNPSIHHIELDESRSIMTVHCWATMKWTDEKLKWNKSEYSGVKKLHMADHEIWQPDLIPYNEAEGSSIDLYGSTDVLVLDDGSCLWVPPAALRVFCALDLRKWPFDTQKCSMKIGSWSYDGLEIGLNLTKNQSSDDFYNLVDNAEWQFVKLDRRSNIVYYDCCKEPYVDITFEITIKRHSPAYKTIIIAPITPIVFMTLTTFWLPPASGEKITLGGTTALVITLYLLYFTQKLGVMAAHTPYIVSFYSASLYLVAFSIVMSVVIINVATNPKNVPIPWILQNFMNTRIGRLILLQNTYQRLSHHTSIRKSVTDDETADNRPVLAEEATNQPTSHQHEWRLLAIILDRSIFLIYCFLFICFALAYLT